MRHIAHPTGRIIGRRPGYKPNIEKLMKLAEETNTILEINANPKRLDLNAETVRKYPNVKLTINTDAHHTESFRVYEVRCGYGSKRFCKKKIRVMRYHESLKSLVENNIKEIEGLHETKDIRCFGIRQD